MDVGSLRSTSGEIRVVDAPVSAPSPTRRILLVTDSPRANCSSLRERIARDVGACWTLVLLLPDGRPGRGLLMEVGQVLQRQGDSTAAELALCLGIHASKAATAAEFRSLFHPHQFDEVLLVSDTPAPDCIRSLRVPILQLPHLPAA